MEAFRKVQRLSIDIQETGSSIKNTQPLERLLALGKNRGTIGCLPLQPPVQGRGI